MNATFGWLLFGFGVVLSSALALLKKDEFSLKIKLAFLALCLVLVPLFGHVLWSLLRFGYAFLDKGIAFALLPSTNPTQFAVFGALLGVVVSAFICKAAFNIKALPLLNAFAPSFALALAFARFAEGLWFMGFGRFVEEEAFAFFPLAIFDPTFESYLYAIFMLEGIVAFGTWLWLNFKPKKDAFLSMLTVLCAFQILFESMRQDDILRWHFVLCNQVFCGLCLLALLVLYLKKAKAKPLVWVLALALFTLCVGLIATMEFALEGRVPLFASFNRLACYGLDLLCVCLMLGEIFGLQGIAFGSKVQRD